MPVRRALRPAHRGGAGGDRGPAPRLASGAASCGASLRAGSCRDPALLRAVAAALRVYQRSGLQRLVRASGLLRLLPAAPPRLGGAAPAAAAARAGRAPLPEVVPAQGPRRARVAFLTGCVQDAVFGAHNEATLRCLARNGAEVAGPARPGLLRRAARPRRRARARARRWRARRSRPSRPRAWRRSSSTPSGCGAHMKAYGHLLRGDPAWAARAAAFARTVQDVTEFLAQAPLRGPLGPLPLRATYHDPCHVAHGQKMRAAAAGAPARRAGPRAGRARRGGLVLRLGGHLQPDPARDGAAPARAQGGPRRGDRARRRW